MKDLWKMDEMVKDKKDLRPDETINVEREGVPRTMLRASSCSALSMGSTSDINQEWDLGVPQKDSQQTVMHPHWFLISKTSTSLYYKGFLKWC